MLEWNVYVSDWNAGTIKPYNVFSNVSLMEDTRKNYKKNKDNKEVFLEELRRDLVYYYRWKCEWEITLSHWPPRIDAKNRKIDVYDQVTLNWPRFCEYVLANEKEFAKRSAKK